MDIFFQDPSEVPLPPAEVRIRELTAHPYEDGRRVRVLLEVDPYQKRPSADLVLLDPAGKLEAMTNIIEIFPRKIELTLHLRGQAQAGDYTLACILYYVEIPPAPGPDQPAPSGNVELPEPNIIDRAETTFTIPKPEIDGSS